MSTRDPYVRNVKAQMSLRMDPMTENRGTNVRHAVLVHLVMKALKMVIKMVIKALKMVIKMVMKALKMVMKALKMVMKAPKMVIKMVMKAPKRVMKKFIGNGTRDAGNARDFSRYSLHAHIRFR